MAGALDTKMRTVAQTLINRFGKSVTCKVVTTAGTYSPVDGDAPGEVVTDIALVASPPFSLTKDYVPDDTLNRGEVILYLAALDCEAATPAFVPHQDMIVVMDSENWFTRKVMPLYSGSLVAAYVLELEKGTYEPEQ